MDKKINIIIILALIILIGSGVYAYNYVRNEGYKQGFQDATIIINEQVTDNLNQNGYIIFNYAINQTSFIPIKLIPEVKNVKKK